MRSMMAAAVVLLYLGGPVSAQPFEWQKAAPESQSMSGEKLDALKDALAKRRTRALLVVRNDQIVYEWYAEGVTAGTKQGTASLAKALVGGLSLGVAVNDKLIALDDPAAKFIPEWKDDPKKSKITVRQLGSHTSGLADSVTRGAKNEDQPGWKGEFWKRRDPPNDPFTIARDKTPMLFEPGKDFQYSNPGIALLTYCVTASIKDAKHRDVRALLKERVMKPIGVPDAEWSAGYGKTYTVNGLSLVGSWGGAAYTPRAAARIGRLVLREGDWDGRRVLSRDAVEQIAHDAGLPGHCGMGWWTNGGRRYDWLPKDAVWGAGAGDQVLLVVPSLKLIMVRNGDALFTADELKKLNPKDVFEEFHDPRANVLFKPLVEAVTDRAPTRAPYPPSRVITGIEWAPKDAIVRKAKGSDNWPLTWADDDHQYTAYGDGNGFEPFVPEKLGLGIARVEGEPDKFTGVNVRAPTAENRGYGKDGKKASGTLVVDGVLYMLTRNAGNSQLAWSKDHGKTWEWAGWKFTTSFGCPTFLNFGKNYDGARDEFVYVYSHDADSAYQPADRMVLARVPKGKIAERSAYEFFKGLDVSNQPAWIKTIGERGAVFTHTSRCYRSGITYNAALKRYLWVQILPDTNGKKADTRFEGGFAIYDAPEPWGPWTTAFFTEKWDAGPGETASFPTKWMSADGRTLHLVFSGDDHFSVRKASLSGADK
ncbi:MAG: serine hydrolase [Planctomycetes bacterium]|nr:serine hydrolase [Planctomycetota bacterium]